MSLDLGKLLDDPEFMAAAEAEAATHPAVEQVLRDHHHDVTGEPVVDGVDDLRLMHFATPPPPTKRTRQRRAPRPQASLEDIASPEVVEMAFGSPAPVPSTLQLPLPDVGHAYEAEDLVEDPLVLVLAELRKHGDDLRHLVDVLERLVKVLGPVDIGDLPEIGLSKRSRARKGGVDGAAE